jgi:hypothetical protein
MYWKCPECGSLFVRKESPHECAGEKRFTIRGEIPDGEPLPVGAHQEPRNSGRLADVLRIVRKLAGVAVHR